VYDIDIVLESIARRVSANTSGSGADGTAMFCSQEL
jgi:hypothetical protein